MENKDRKVESNNEKSLKREVLKIKRKEQSIKSEG